VQDREREPAARLQHAGDGGDTAVQIVDVRQAVVADHGVEARPGQHVRIGARPVGVHDAERLGSLCGDRALQLGRGEVESGHRGTLADQDASHPARAAGQVEDPAAPNGSDQAEERLADHVPAQVRVEPLVQLGRRVVPRHVAGSVHERLSRAQSLRWVPVTWNRAVRLP